MALGTYRKKRDFSKTPEPSGKHVAKSGHVYVIQQHAASHLHFDFRLELDGVLKSWAVPKGPSLDPSVKRLAVEVEDHPVEYGDFEGTIPQGQYGGGTVMVWDQGTWEPTNDPQEGIKKGKLEFELQGERLKGQWILLRTARKAAKPQWLLIKRNDDEAEPDSDKGVLERFPNSVVTGRTMEEIAEGRKAARQNKKMEDPNRSSKDSKRAKKTDKTISNSSAKRRQNSAENQMPMLDGAKKAKQPAFVEPQLATLVNEAPDGDDWLHEIKFDGYRMQCHLHNGTVKLFSRRGNDWTAKVPSLAQALSELPAKNAILDGELVSMNDTGTTDFQSLQNGFRDKETQTLSIYLFDLLYLNGQSLLDCPLEERKGALEELLKGQETSNVYYSKHIVGRGSDYQSRASELGLEGIVCKRRDGKYRSGRTHDWLKVKVLNKEEFVIGGFTSPAGARVGLGALLVGYYDREERLLYAGKVGTGFDDATLRSLHSKLQSLRCDSCPFEIKALPVHPPSNAHWVEPRLVAQIRFGALTRDKILRHAVFEGLREDKPSEEVMLDRPMPWTEAIEKAPDAASTKKALKRSKPSTAGRRQSSSRVNSAQSEGATDQFEGIRLTSPEKVLDPTTGFTKLDLATYYRDIGEWMLPHLQHRPISLFRCPDGLGDACFYQKHPTAGTPDELRQIPIQEKSGETLYAIVDDGESLMSLAQIGALEIHAWGSKEDELEKPDRLVFDLDPDAGVDWKNVVAAAKQVRSLLSQLKLDSFVKTTGGKGLHVVVPIQRRNDWDEAKLFSHLISQMIESEAPDRFTLNPSKATRKGRIFMDYLRNDRGSTSVVPYSPRAREGIPVSTPLAWDELTARVKSDRYTISNIRTRLEKLDADPWKGIGGLRQNIGSALRILQDNVKQPSGKTKKRK